ncbi:hypothetical protein COHA_003080 [Chlorella ohadii]|uniref:Uncharacterized protein n=1 Tax=Chlorella ohadii TaxID=2649997 RepID=A0AAD5H471_9CHLO|nr:hypothetical protein COHA_003080 [Chlorella ohadii]
MRSAGRLACAAAASICLLCASLVAGRTLLEGLPFDMPSECAGIASVNVLRLLQQIQRDCPRPPPEGYNCPGSCGDALASIKYRCAEAAAAAQAQASGGDLKAEGEWIKSLFRACPWAILGKRVQTQAPGNSSAGQPQGSPVPPASPPAAPVDGNTSAGAGDWSPWLGRSTPQSVMAVCPCPGYIQGFSVWYEQGRNVSFEDAGPIIGLTAHCTPYLLAGQQPGALVELQVFPGQGPPDFSLNFTSGLPNVTVKYGQFLDSFLGAGGAGTSQGEASCWPGHVITGIHVAWEPAPVAPFSNLATGVMVHCSDPNTCPGSSADAPAPTYPASSPPPGPPKHDIPSGTWSDGSPAPPTSPPAAPVDGNSSEGSFSVWYEKGMRATPADRSPISGLIAKCAGGNNEEASLEVFSGQGSPKATLNFPTGITSVAVQLGQFLDSFMGAGGTGTTQTNFTCQRPGQRITGFQAAWEPSPVRPGTNIATGVRVHCSDPDICIAASWDALPSGTWSEWLGPGHGPSHYGGICPCNSTLQVCAP